MKTLAIILFGVGAMLAFVAGLVLEVLAIKKYGLFKSFILPFEEILVCFSDWKSAKPAAKLLLVGMGLVLLSLLVSLFIPGFPLNFKS